MRDIIAKLDEMNEESPKYDPDGRGIYSVTYVFPDKKNISSERFETEAEAKKFARELKRKGYHDIELGKNQEADPSYYMEESSGQTFDTKAEAQKAIDAKEEGEWRIDAYADGNKQKFQIVQVDRFKENTELQRIAKLSGLGGSMGMFNGNLNKKLNEDEDPCWDGYEQVGMKEKDGKEVPNCVPKESVEEAQEHDAYDYTVQNGGVLITRNSDGATAFLQPGDESNEFLNAIEKLLQKGKDDMAQHYMSQYDDVMSIQENCGCGPDCDCPDCAEHNNIEESWYDIRDLSEDEIEYLESLAMTEDGDGLLYGGDHGLEEYMVSSDNNAVLEFLNSLVQEDDKEWANSPDEEYQEIDYMVDKIAGGLNRKKKQYLGREGDNPKAVQDVPVEDDDEDEEIREGVQKHMDALPYSFMELYRKYSSGDRNS